MTVHTRWRVAAVLAAVAFLCGLGTPAGAQSEAPPLVFTFMGEGGFVIGQGTAAYVPPADTDIRIFNDSPAFPGRDYVQGNVIFPPGDRFGGFELAAPTGDLKLGVGRFLTSSLSPPPPHWAQFRLGYHGRECSPAYGEVDILEVTHGADGLVSGLALDYTVQCGVYQYPVPGVPRLHGSIRLNSDVPYRYTWMGQMHTEAREGEGVRGTLTLTNHGTEAQTYGPSVWEPTQSPADQAPLMIRRDGCAGVRLGSGEQCDIEVATFSDGIRHVAGHVRTPDGTRRGAAFSPVTMRPVPTSPDQGPLPVLAVAHALPNAGVNLWEVHLAPGVPDRGTAYLQRTLREGGWAYHQSRTVSGDFGDVTESDRGPDTLLVHQQPGGGLLLWVAGGGAEPKMRADLRTGGWSWADSRQMAGDVDGDGLDDVVSVHRNTVAPGQVWANVWVHLNVGSGAFADPVLWQSIDPRGWAGAHQAPAGAVPFVDSRFLLGDVDGDDRADLVSVHRGGSADAAILYGTWLSTGTAFAPTDRPSVASGRDGWSYDHSRDVLADVDADGRAELVDIHAQPGDGVLFWVRQPQADGTFGSDPSVMADLRHGGWSYTGSRQSVVDVDRDGADDLVSVHSQGAGGLLVWSHRSSGPSHAPVLEDPVLTSDLRSGGWSFTHSRESATRFATPAAPAF